MRIDHYAPLIITPIHWVSNCVHCIGRNPVSTIHPKIGLVAGSSTIPAGTCYLAYVTDEDTTADYSINGLPIHIYEVRENASGKYHLVGYAGNKSALGHLVLVCPPAWETCGVEPPLTGPEGNEVGIEGAIITIYP